MAVVQNTYPQFHDALINGQIANTVTCDVDSLNLRGSDAVPFGRAVCASAVAGAGDRDVDLGVRRRNLALINNSGGYNSSATSMAIDGLTDGDVRVGSYIVIGSEILHVSAATTTTLTVARGELGSTAASHNNNAPIRALDDGLFSGISVQDQRLPAGREEYETGEAVSVLRRGDIVVTVSAAVGNEDNVVAATAASGSGNSREEVGQLSTKRPDATHVTLSGAKFKSTAAAQGLAVVRVD